MSKRYIELVEVDDNGNRKVISSEEQKAKFDPKKSASDFAEKHPKVVKVAKVTGLVILAGGAAILGAAAVKGKSRTSQTNLLSDEDMKLLQNPESDTDTVPVDDAEEVSDTEC